ncbi:NF038129 family PEP-CTERM protein [Pseudoduganella sp. LjRoot289]|uniref:NF038129 family PEP-CTERM protein n=1 Tax=Pseudoduganella sp. LjRoot289 TaxID=3342314 RepID=UPI003ECEB9CB
MNIDIKHRFSSLLRHLALAVTLAAGSSFASAGVIHVAIDTSTFNAASGYLDMQLSASGGVPLATAVVSNMVGFGGIDLNFGVTAVAGGFGFRNDTPNYLSHTATFGGLLSFDLAFDGAYDPLTQYVSHFVVTAYDEAFAPQGAFDQATGALADFSWTPSLTQGGSGSLGLAVSNQSVTVVPEPAALLLMAVGLVAMALVLRRRSVPPRHRHGAGMGFGLAA